MVLRGRGRRGGQQGGFGFAALRLPLALDGVGL